MKKILVLANNSQTIIKFRKDMILGFLERNYLVTIVSPDETYRKSIENMGCNLISLNYRKTGTNPINDICLYFKYKKIIKQFNPDKIFSYNLKPVIYGILAGRKNHNILKYAMIPGAGYIFSGDSVKSKIIKKIIKPLYKKSLSNAEWVFFQNVDDKKQFIEEKIVDSSKSIVVNGSGINLDDFPYSRMPQKLTFLFAARLIKSKGIIEYCKMAEIVKKKYPETKFNVIGGLDDNPQCIKKEELNYYIDNKIIDYHGSVENVKKYLEDNSVLVLPSYHREGVPHVVLEAMSVGRIIITTNEIGCKETVKDGINGFLISSHNIDELVAKVLHIIDNYKLCKSMGKESRKYAEEKFDVRKVNNIIFEKMNL